MSVRGSSTDAEQASYDKNGRYSLLAVEDTDTNKTTKVMTDVHNDKNCILTSTLLVDDKGIPISESNPLHVDTELVLDADNVVVNIKRYEIDDICNSNDAVTTINYTDATKSVVSNIVTSSTSVGRKVTDTFDDSGATTLTITRGVADVWKQSRTLKKSH